MKKRRRRRNPKSSTTTTNLLLLYGLVGVGVYLAFFVPLPANALANQDMGGNDFGLNTPTNFSD
jgi:hypothetical protein